MIDLSARVAVGYAALAFPIALLCAIPAFDHHGQLDSDGERRYLRRAWVLVLASPLHVLLPLTALFMAREASRLSNRPEPDTTRRARLTASSVVGVVVAIGVFLSLAAAAA